MTVEHSNYAADGDVDLGQRRNGCCQRQNRSTRNPRQDHNRGMAIRIQCLCIDTGDPAKTASFWQSALGWRRTSESDDEVVLEPPEGSPEDGVAPGLLFLRVPEGKVVKNRLHLDLRPAIRPPRSPGWKHSAPAG